MHGMAHTLLLNAMPEPAVLRDQFKLQLPPVIHGQKYLRGVLPPPPRILGGSLDAVDGVHASDYISESYFSAKNSPTAAPRTPRRQEAKEENLSVGVLATD
jgi:hypothetical protein